MLTRLRAFFSRIIHRFRHYFVDTKTRVANIERFNLLVSDVVNENARKIGICDERGEKNFQRIQDLSSQLQMCRQQLQTTEALLKSIQNFIHFQPQKLAIQEALDTIPEIDYLKFENTFRGSEELIKERQLPYLSYFQNCDNILDIGCGRGEFLELLRNNGHECLGIDIDTNMCNYCESKKLKVIQDDVFHFLLHQDDESFDGVFSAQFIEHLDPIYLQKFVYLLVKKLRAGGRIVLETVNPLCLQAYQHFYTDLSHVKPIFPEVIRFIAESYGLKTIAFLLRTPVREGLLDPQVDQAQPELYGDYAIIFEK